MAENEDEKGVILLLLIGAVSLLILLVAREYLSRALLDATMEVLESGSSFLESNF